MILGRILSLAAAGFRSISGFIPVAGAATWNPSDKNAAITLSNGDRTATKTSGDFNAATFRATLPKTSGKWYIEAEVKARSGVLGDGKMAIAVPATSLSAAPGASTAGALVHHDNVYVSAGFSAPSGTAVNWSGDQVDLVMAAFDLDNRRCWIGRNGTWLFSGNPVTNTNPTVTWAGVADPIYLAGYMYFVSSYAILNAGQEAFTYPVPAGFNAGWYQNDPFTSNVVLLMHMDGNLSDETGHAVTNINSVTTDGTSQFGSGAAVFNRTNNLTIASATDYLFDGDFTAECWVRPIDLIDASSGVGFITTSNLIEHDQNGFFFGSSTGKLFGICGNGTWGTAVVGGTSIPLGQWSHVAFVRNGSDLYLFLNGNLDGTGTFSGPLTNVANLISVGGRQHLSQLLNGRIDEVRVTKGIARYTSNFSVSSSPFNLE